jgi:hypothetical protein
MLVPTPSSTLQELAELRERARFLERALAVTLTRLGKAWTDASLECEAARDAVAELGRMVETGRASEAARRYRDLFGVTWDEAHFAVARWDIARVPELARRLWLQWWLEVEGGRPSSHDSRPESEAATEPGSDVGSLE